MWAGTIRRGTYGLVFLYVEPNKYVNRKVEGGCLRRGYGLARGGRGNMGDSNGADCGHGAHYIGVKILLRYYYKAIFYIMICINQESLHMTQN